MAYSAELRCMAGCDTALPVTAAVYRCPRCAGLLKVTHDETELKKTSPEAWKQLFEARFRTGRGPLASGVWGKREWVMPEVPDDLVVTAGEGATTLFWAERYGKAIGVPDLHVKQCGTSHTGSFKDLGMTVLVSTVRLAMARGLSVSAIACASTGDTSAALAAYGAQCGLPVVVLLPRGKVSTAQLVQPLAAGARVFALDTDFDGCMAIIDRLAAENLVYLANSMNALRLEGQKTVALEMTQQLDWTVPDWVVLPGGNLGNAYAVYLGFQQLLSLGLIDKLPRLAIAQAQAANPLYRAFAAGDLDNFSAVRAAATLATAIQIGNPVSYPRAKIALRAMNGVVAEASEEELAEAAARADRTGLYTCPHTAVALAAVEKLRAAGTIQEHERVVVVSTASGLKFTEFKVRYHEGSLPNLSAQQRNAPIELPADFGAVADALKAS
jgi:threonine synthase